MMKTDEKRNSDKFVEYYAQESQSDETLRRFSRIRDRALALLEEARRSGPFDVIDIGCGAGTQALLWAGLGHRVMGIDVNQALVDIARERAIERGMTVRFDVGSATHLPYAKECADVVLMPELLEHVPDWERCLREAVRVLRPGGLLYLSTTNWLCPRQQEFTLPGYSWYPSFVKHRFERLATTTRPELVNHAKFPAVNWFTYYGLARWLRGAGFDTMDRFDMLSRQQSGKGVRLFVNAARALAPVRFIGHVLTEGTAIWALRRRNGR